MSNNDDWLNGNDWLNKIVKCPKCGREVLDGNRIWLDGECLCPQCYMAKRAKYDNMMNR